MFTIDEIKDLIKTLDQSSLDELVYQNDGKKLKLKKQANQSNKSQPTFSPTVTEQTVIQEDVIAQSTQVAPEQVEPSQANYDYEVTSPMVGTFYLAATPESQPYVSIGDQVTKGKVVCMIEAMKLFNEIESDVSGEIVELLAENGELVEYGQPLFGIKQK